MTRHFLPESIYIKDQVYPSARRATEPGDKRVGEADGGTNGQRQDAPVARRETRCLVWFVCAEAPALRASDSVFTAMTG